MRKVLNTIITVISWIILVLALLVTILVFSADANGGVPSLLGFIPLTVESDSMEPTFSKDDLIIDKEIDDVYKLKEGDVITFWTLISGYRVKNTHRIISVNNADANINFTTKGDNNDMKDSLNVYPADIIGQWTGIELNGWGKAVNFLRTKTGFFICIIVPMIVFFLFELYKLIAVIVEVSLTAYIMICNMQGKAAVVFGRSVVKVISGSMEPSIHDGDYIVIKKADCSALKEGDIICFYSREDEIYGIMNTHRIIRILDDGSFVTKGDANSIEDSAVVTADNIVGKYEGKVRLLRWLNSFTSLKKIILAAVVVIMSVTAVYEVITIAKVSAECRAKKADNEAAVRRAIDIEKQKLYEQNSAEKKERGDI